jgi:hypothetical protein
MPALPSPDSFTTPIDDSTSFVSLLRRALEPRTSTGAYTKPSNIGAGVLVVFCLIGGSLGLLAWWLFIRRSGFIWRASDWQDYKASVLRRPDERPDDAITVFSDGTARRGGGSSVGARTVVLGELDTTYTKSHVEKLWGPRDQPGKDSPRKKGLLETVWSDVKGSVWGGLRGGEPSESDTIIQREKSLQRERSRRRRHHRRRSTRRKESRRKESWRKEEIPSEVSDMPVDRQRPAPPLKNLTKSTVRRPARASTRAGKATVTRESSYAVGGDKTARYHRHQRTRSAVTEESSDESSSSSDSSSSSEESDSDDDDSTIDQSQLGMAKGNKVYHHPISPEHVFWGNARPVERNGGGAGGTFGGGAPAVMPAPRGYRAASVGSLSSVGSVGSSNAGRK